jgi:hypothetical protein
MGHPGMCDLRYILVSLKPILLKHPGNHPGLVLVIGRFYIGAPPLFF